MFATETKIRGWNRLHLVSLLHSFRHILSFDKDSLQLWIFWLCYLSGGLVRSGCHLWQYQYNLKQLQSYRESRQNRNQQQKVGTSTGGEKQPKETFQKDYEIDYVDDTILKNVYHSNNADTFICDNRGGVNALIGFDYMYSLIHLWEQCSDILTHYAKVLRYVWIYSLSGVLKKQHTREWKTTMATRLKLLCSCGVVTVVSYDLVNALTNIYSQEKEKNKVAGGYGYFCAFEFQGQPSQLPYVCSVATGMCFYTCYWLWLRFSRKKSSH
ncbi:hypothetical protein RFI_04966 [Reticulomyxa filosa]|uniref:Uncharacterized protein n=1 Tax=Reticulomyxa filosa TaxID=46433 RepID=X6P3K0_RETFI|nr:hypothetical protein RFI_04966 [Reticulomyxa filosa]|eukprot:ETO32147.1 hypothetical protein RFI_04966 [Reticulomyxa filosa]